MDFYQSVTDALYSRMEDNSNPTPLESCGAYMKAIEEYRAIMEGIKDRDSAKRIELLLWKLCDLKAQYYYRMGLQDGVSLTTSDFLTRGIS